MIELIYWPNDIFRQIAAPVESINQDIRNIIDDMFKIIYDKNAVGMGANMVGVLKRIVVIDIQENSAKNPISLINPEIIWSSSETQSFTEGSISIPGISAMITRPKEVKVKYLDYNANEQILDASGWLATVLQHEIDYLNGIIFLDHVSKMKKEMLLKKLKKNANQ